MGIVDRLKTSAALSRKAEEFLYERALDEYECGDIRRGLWAQALAEAEGNESRAKGLYLKLRVRAMVDEGVIADQVMQQAERLPEPEASVVHDAPRPRDVESETETQPRQQRLEDEHRHHDEMVWNVFLIVVIVAVVAGVAAVGIGLT